MNLESYIMLGRSGLRVSPLCLGTMTFGTDWGWGADEATARSLFDHYVDAGGNFIDTADGYTGGKSETWVGKMMSERKLRDKIVLATKFTFSGEAKNPNAGGNGRKNIYRALEGSLRRLGTDYIDLYYVHCWDMHTPIEEVASTLTDLVRSGKVRNIGLSDVPAWYASRYQTLAAQNGWERIAALQLEYSLVERSIEREHVPMARELGIGVLPWSPLASGFLAGKYKRDAANKPQLQQSSDSSLASTTSRIEVMKDSTNPVFSKLANPSEKSWKTLDEVNAIARELDRSAAEVSLAWAAGQPGITSTIIGATKLEQLKSNIRALDITLSKAQRDRLNAASELESVHPYMYFGDVFQEMIHGGASVRAFPG